MSAAIHNHVVADATTSTFDQVKHGAIDAGNWVGRKIQLIASFAKDIIMKIIETVKPIFAYVLNFVREQSAKAREFILANKELSTIAIVGVPLVALLTLGSYWLICGNEPKPAAK